MCEQKAFNLATLKQSRSLGVIWHYTTFLACGHNLDWIPEGIKALQYDGNVHGIDNAISDIVAKSESAADLLCNLDHAGLHGFITLAKLPNQIFLNDGKRRLCKSTVDFWFYADSIEALTHKINPWAHQQLKVMKAHSPVCIADQAINEVVAAG